MRKQGLLNQPIAGVIAGMGHTDSIVLCDAGLPIPDGTHRIDLAVRCGTPPFIETLESILGELEVERAAIAEETRRKSPQLHEALLRTLGDIPVDYIDHEELKARSGRAKAVVRTGECTPFANVILYSGVVF
ncbi:MAG: D-ribose pyranase [Spirochaetaceae bacterium]